LLDRFGVLAPPTAEGTGVGGTDARGFVFFPQPAAKKIKLATVIDPHAARNALLTLSIVLQNRI
jgi:hypothetical protein